MFCECFVIAMKISGRTRIQATFLRRHFPRNLLSTGTAIRLTSHSRVTVVTNINFLPTDIRRSSKVKVLRITKLIACVAGARKWAQERTGAREGYTRGRGSACTKGPRKSRVSFSRARFFLRPFIS